MSHNAAEIVARAEFRHPLTTRNADELEAEVTELLMAAMEAFPTLPLEASSQPRDRNLHVFVSGHPRLVTMMKVRLLYRGWKLVGRIQFAEMVAVRPTVPLRHDPLVWASVRSPARNTVEPVAPNMSVMHVPTRMGYQQAANAAMAARHRSAHTYGVGMPYGHTAAHVAGLVHAMRGSSELTPSPPRAAMETNAQYRQRRRYTQAMRNIARRRNAILAVAEAAATERARTTRKARARQHQ